MGVAEPVPCEGVHVDYVSTAEALDYLERQLRRTALALHDGPIQTLASAGAMLERTQRSTDIDCIHAESAAAAGLVDHAIFEIREMMRELRPAPMEADGLDARVREFALDFETEWGLPTVVSISGEDALLSPRCQCTVLRIIQEALTNVRRHADASKASVDVTCSEDWVVVTVADDGIGFNLPRGAVRSPESRWGLSGMSEQVALLGGQLKVMSTPHEGTRVRAMIPRDAPWL
jgi:signal transduction histidine kinase